MIASKNALAVGEEKISPTATASQRFSPIYPINAGLCPEPPPVTIPTFPSTGAFLYFNTLASSVVDTISLCVFTKPFNISSTTKSGLFTIRFIFDFLLNYIASAIAFKFLSPSIANSSPVSAKFLQIAQFPANSSKLGSKDSITSGPSYPISSNA